MSNEIILEKLNKTYFFVLAEIQLEYNYRYVKDYTDREVTYTNDIKKAMRFTSIYSADYHKENLPSTLQHFRLSIAPTKKILTEEQANNYRILSGMDLPFNFYDLDEEVLELSFNLNVDGNWPYWCRTNNNFGLQSSIEVAKVLVNNGIKNFNSVLNLVKLIEDVFGVKYEV